MRVGQHTRQPQVHVASGNALGLVANIAPAVRDRQGQQHTLLQAVIKADIVCALLPIHTEAVLGRTFEAARRSLAP